MMANGYEKVTGGYTCAVRRGIWKDCLPDRV